MKVNLRNDNESLVRMTKIVVILLGAAFYFYYGIYKMLFVHSELVGNDFLKGYFAARNFVQGDPIYAMPEGVNPYYYFPLTALIFLPFCNLTPHIAIMCWFIIIHLIILFCFLTIVRYGYHLSKMNSIVAAMTAACCSMPLYQAVITGNVNILILLGLCLVYGSLIFGKKKLVPYTLACCTFLKIYPALLMAPFLKNRDFTACKTFLFFAILLTTLSILIFGLPIHFDFIRNLPSGSKYVGIFHAMSFTFLMKLFSPEYHNNMLFIWNFIFCLSILFVWWKRSRAYSELKGGNSFIVVDLIILTVITVLVFPSSWLMCHALFIPSFYFILFARLQDRNCLVLFPLFILLFSLINFWEIIAYHFPLSFDGLTMYQVSENRGSFPILYPILASVPFILNIVFFVWLLINYDNLRRVITTLKAPKLYQINDNKCSK